jgi:hypothetical protein
VMWLGWGDFGGNLLGEGGYGGDGRGEDMGCEGGGYGMFPAGYAARSLEAHLAVDIVDGKRGV